MPLSKAALLCLESSSFLTADLLGWRADSVTTPAKRIQHGEFHTQYEHLRSDPASFFAYLNMSVETFDYILNLISSDLAAAWPTSRTCNADEKLFVTLRYLATGMTLSTLAATFQVGRSTVSMFVFVTMNSIWKALSPIHLRSPTYSEMSTLANEYYEKWKFPNCIGAIGGKYVRVLSHTMNIEKVRRYNKKSVVINAVTDANFRFLAVDIVSKRNHDIDFYFKDIFQNTGMQCLPGTETMLPLVIIGNEAFPLRSYLMKPYAGRNPYEPGRKRFNTALKRARVTVDCAFEILTEKWKIYTRPFGLNLEHATLVIRATCLLHNVIHDRDGRKDMHFSKFGQVDNGSIYLDLVTRGSRKFNRATSISISIREQFTRYFNDQAT